jgi:hypothetical protein
MWTTFQCLPFGKLCCIGKDMSGFVKVDFFNKNRFNQFAPPSCIFNYQTNKQNTKYKKLNSILWTLGQTKRRKGFLNSFKIGHLIAKIRFFFHFWAPFWILTPI